MSIKKKKNISAIIEARMTSVRFPGKVLKKINGKEILKIIIERLNHSKKIDKIVVATTKDKKDDKIVSLLKKMDIPYYRGSTQNVLSRIVNCAKKNKIENILRVTADNPLTDYILADKMISYYEKYNKYDYLTNNHFADKARRKIAYGLDLSLFSLKSLLRVKNFAKKNAFFLEYPTLYYYTSGKSKFKIKNINHSKKLIIDETFRLTVDTLPDLKLFQKLFNLYFKTFKKDKYLYLSKLRVLLNYNSSLKKINQDIVHYKPYLKFLKKKSA